MTETIPPELPEEDVHPSIARNAAVLSLASIFSRVLGMVREIIIPHFYGATGLVSAYALAEFVAKILYDLLVGGMLSAALVPVLSDYRRPEKRAQFAQVASVVFTAIAILAGVVVLIVEVFAPQIVFLIGGDLSPEYQIEAIRLMRITAPVIWVFSASGGLAAILFARERFTMVALGDALYNLGVIIVVPLFHKQLGIEALAFGMVLGGLIQLAFRLPDLRGSGLHVTRHLRNPVLKRVWKLYLPILIAVLVSMIQGGIDRRLASGTGDSSLAYMRTATTLYQLPHGLVAVAISMASLPSLSRWAAAKDWSAYKSTLAAGLRAVLVLVIPATVFLWVLAAPTVRLLAEHGEFTPTDTYWTYLTLRYYLVGLVFASVDWPLNFAYYARGDSKTPAIVGILAVGVYLIFALTLLPYLSFLGLAFADGMKQMAHAFMMIFLLWRWGGRLEHGVGRTALVSTGAALIMGVVLYLSADAMMARMGTADLIPRVLTLLIPGLLGGVIYYLILRWLRVPEVDLLHGLAGRAMGLGRK